MIKVASRLWFSWNFCICSLSYSSLWCFCKCLLHEIRHLTTNHLNKWIAYHWLTSHSRDVIEALSRNSSCYSWQISRHQTWTVLVCSFVPHKNVNAQWMVWVTWCAGPISTNDKMQWLHSGCNLLWAGQRDNMETDKITKISSKATAQKSR